MSTRGQDPERPRCPTGCGRTVSAGKLMCPGCWREVPKDLQREVYRLWRSWQRSYDPETWKQYLEARERAIGAIR